VKGKLNFLFDVDIEFKLTQVNSYGVGFRIFRIFLHLFIPSNLIEKTRDLSRGKDDSKNLTVRTVRKHIICHR
jgi:hypothetical protein